ncbi:hypothetical protein GRI75_06575 [Altererythrobacter soli]|uniref:Uncharacterized protein n=1 Tax=Croceibacterium soli TaxID=1739690 RepID=A0A6I4UU30_9SPHN|nr:hypothetical protein [Croceibacterium soli]MXP41304.1 hypothetical protein [Croceibacterium soli]
MMVRQNAASAGQGSHPTLAMLRDSLAKALPAVDDGEFDDLLRKLDSRYAGSRTLSH